jgi:SAM-dependent methyltransferase
MKVELGGGTKPRPGYDVQIDPVHGHGRWKRLAQDTPWSADSGNPLSARPRTAMPAGSVDAVYASHVLEHIPAGAPRLAVFNEAWRVLKPGGRFELWVPLLAYRSTVTCETVLSGELWPALADPTHVSLWIFPESLLYFTGGIEHDADYGIMLWDMDTWSVDAGWNGYACLRKPKTEESTP